MIKVQRFYSFWLILVGFILAACAYNVGLVNTTYDLLNVAKASYETAMSMGADLDRQGRLPADVKAKIMSVGGDYAKAHNLAVAALRQYRKTKNATDEEAMRIQIASASVILSDLLGIIQPYLED